MTRATRVAEHGSTSSRLLHEVSRDPDIQALFKDLVRAKREHRHELSKRLDLPLVLVTRQAWLAALESYAAGLDGWSLPTPPTVHRDLEMLRVLCDNGPR